MFSFFYRFYLSFLYRKVIVVALESVIDIVKEVHAKKLVEKDQEVVNVDVVLRVEIKTVKKIRKNHTKKIKMIVNDFLFFRFCIWN